jgi:hypothetical protein
MNDQLRAMSDTDFVDYLRRVADDHAESGKDATAEDYREAARRLGNIPWIANFAKEDATD